MTDLRKEARGKLCQVRIPGVCNHDPDTTVLAHYNGAGLSGMGLKTPDICGAWACSECHAVIDGHKARPRHMSAEDVELDHLRGCMRTAAAVARLGAI